jgi:hypothetical protein
MTKEEVLARLREISRDAGGQNHAARRLGVSVSYLHDVLAQRRTIGPSILQALGLQKIITYQEIAE